MKLYIPVMPEDVWAALDFIAARVKDFEPSASASVMASVKDGKIIGAVAYQNYRQTEIEMVCAGAPGWLNKTAIKAYFAYPFLQLGCRRASVIIHKKNKRSRRFAERLGFKMEGVHKKAMADGGDAISYAMLKEDCRWIN